MLAAVCAAALTCLVYLYARWRLDWLQFAAAALLMGFVLLLFRLRAPDRTPCFPETDASEDGMVFIHVYDLANSEMIRIMNSCLLTFWVGGAFHAGIEVFGQEWCYGYICKEDNSGVPGSGAFASTPRSNAEHGYRMTIPMGRSKLNEEQAAALLEKMTKEWADTQFDTFRHNCLHFCNALCEELGVGTIPPWLDRGQRIAGMVFGSAPVTEESEEERRETLDDMAMDQCGSSAF